MTPRLPVRWRDSLDAEAHRRFHNDAVFHARVLVGVREMERARPPFHFTDDERALATRAVAVGVLMAAIDPVTGDPG